MIVIFIAQAILSGKPCPWMPEIAVDWVWCNIALGKEVGRSVLAAIAIRGADHQQEQGIECPSLACAEVVCTSCVACPAAVVTECATPLLSEISCSLEESLFVLLLAGVVGVHIGRVRHAGY